MHTGSCWFLPYFFQVVVASPFNKIISLVLVNRIAFMLILSPFLSQFCVTLSISQSFDQCSSESYFIFRKLHKMCPFKRISVLEVNRLDSK